MNRQTWSILITVLSLIGGVAMFLNTQRSRQKLGQPGVKIISEATYGIDRGVTNHGEGRFVARTNSVFLPARVLDYVSEPLPVERVVLNALPADTLFANRLYRRAGGFDINCQVVLMGSDRSSIHRPQHCLGGSGFTIVSQEKTTIPISTPVRYALPVEKLTLRRNLQLPHGEQQSQGGVFVYWLVADNRLTADNQQRMWEISKEMLRSGTLQRWAYVICFAPCPLGREESVYEQMKEFLQAAVPEFQIAPRTPLPVADTVAVK
jgi:hypothetical protein